MSDAEGFEPRRPARDRRDGLRRFHKRAMVGSGRSYDRRRGRPRFHPRGVMVRYWKHIATYAILRTASLGAIFTWTEG